MRLEPRRAVATAAFGLALLVASNVQAEPMVERPKEAAGPLFHPDGPGSGRLRVGVGLLMDVLPKRVVESEQRQFPQLTTHARLGGPFGFSASARLAAIVIKNEIDLGLVWSHSFGPISLGLSEHVGFSYGLLTVQGFDATSWAFVQQPGLLVGASWREHRFALTTELLTTFGQRTRLGDAEVLSRRSFVVSGVSWLVTSETMLDSGGELYVGVGAILAQPDYQVWIAFSDERSRILYPRFMAGYVF